MAAASELIGEAAPVAGAWLEEAGEARRRSGNPFWGLPAAEGDGRWARDGGGTRRCFGVGERGERSSGAGRTGAEAFGVERPRPGGLHL